MMFPKLPARLKDKLPLYVRLSRLDTPADLVLLLLPMLAATWLASAGKPKIGALLLVLLAATALRCFAHVFNDFIEKRLFRIAPESLVAAGKIGQQEARNTLIALISLSALLLLPLGLPTYYFAPVALAVAVAYPYVKHHSFLTQPLMGFGFAWGVPMAWVAQGSLPDKSGWLLFVAILFWASAFTTLYAIPRRAVEARLGIGSLALLFGDASRYIVAALQLGALIAFWLSARQAQLGIFPDLALFTALGLFVHQQYLLKNSDDKSGPMKAYYNNIWVGIALFCGYAFHFLCACSIPVK